MSDLRGQFFWLHIKKSAGTTVRALLQPYYVEVDRTSKPKIFLEAEPEEFNDILNNYRILLGEYQFKRCQFAKKFLYGEGWDDLYSFAFCREPIQRCVSMFHYLFWDNSSFSRQIKSSLKRSIDTKKLLLNNSYAFDAFLECIKESRMSESVFDPLGLHFSTHTAPMWDDITDENGNSLLKAVFRLDDLIDGINNVFYECNLKQRIERSTVPMIKNKRKNKRDYQPTARQISAIESIYTNDFELYESL